MSPTPQPHHMQSQRHPRAADHRRDLPDGKQIDLGKIRFGAQVDAQLYADIAQEAAEAIAASGRGEKNKDTQLRRFYDELCLWNEKINGSGTAEERARRYAEMAPLVKMLKAKVTYARGRKHVDENYEKLLHHVIDEVKDAKTLEQAKLFMEAFSGFYKAIGKG